MLDADAALARCTFRARVTPGLSLQPARIITLFPFVSKMDLLAYWRYDNYRRDLDSGAGFHFNSRQSRLHTAANKGERLWLFTRLIIASQPEYRLLARLNISHKTINAPGYPYGSYRIWGDIGRSRYFKVTADTRYDIFELLRLLHLDGATLQNKNRVTLAQACQTIRILTPQATALLESFADTLDDEPRAKLVPDEEKLESALYADEPTQLNLLLNDESVPYELTHLQNLRQSRDRNRQLVQQLYSIYAGRCQVTAHDSPVIYGAPTAEAHHIVFRSRGGDDDLENMVLISPNLHRAIHAAEARFDYGSLAFLFPNGRVEPLVLNKHLHSRNA
jgi:5-methylcytosine-specific restriction enzyme A